MKCFIEGTVIATETGFARIEDVKHGDIVLSTNIDTMETGYKKVLEKYVRKTRELVHIIVGGKEIVSTPDHPYYVEGRGFVNACQLCIGSPLLDADGKILEVEQIYKEQLGKNAEVKAAIEKNGMSVEDFSKLLDPNRMLTPDELKFVDKVRADIGLPEVGTVMNKTIPQRH